MAITVASTTTAATTSVVRPTASISVVVPTVGVSYAVPVAAVDYIALSVAEELDVTGRYKFIADAQVVVDTTAFSLTKPLADIFAPGSHATFALAKVFSDTQAVTDALAAAVTKIVADTYGIPDAAVHELTKAAFDAFPLTDASIHALNKFFADGVAMNDAFDATDGSLYSIAKYFMNMAFVDETLRRDVDKALVDAVLASEAKVVDFVKVPSADTVSSTDFSVRIAQLSKSDSAGVADIVAYDLTKPLSDVVTYTEYLYRALTKAPFTDSVALADANSLVVGKPLADAVTTADAYAMIAQKALSDSVAFVDVVTTTLIFQRAFYDSAALADTTTLLPSKALTDTISGTSSTAYAISKLLSDGFALNDLADVGDGITFSFGHTVANIAFMSDNSTRQPQLGKAEVVSAADSGSLVNQGYCDLTYFAEDYVGATRSF